MRPIHRSSLLLCLALAAPVWAAVPFEEDLSACKLPNGVVTLPAPTPGDASAAVLLKISNGTFAGLPGAEGGGALAPAQALGRLRENKTADLEYLPATGGGALWAISGRISELGTTYLADAAGRKLSAPMTITGTSRAPAGTYPGVAEGRTYLLQTVDEHYALIRVLEKTPEALVVQYIYQPGSELAFAVPAADKVDYRHPTAGATASPTTSAPATAPAALAAAPSVLSSAPATMPGAPLGPPAAPPDRPRSAGTGGTAGGTVVLRGEGVVAGETSLTAFLKQREQLIQSRMAIVQAPARSPSEIDRKTQAVRDLVALHADEAADLLVSQVAFLNARNAGREFSQEALHPCFAALKRMGKPATEAALKGLRRLDLNEPGEGIESPMYKAGLLGAVIRAVEGEEAGTFLLQRELKAQPEGKSREVFAYLLSGKAGAE